MQFLTLALTRALLRLHRRRAPERGDVPGWVLITVMTAGLVMVIWSMARTQLTQMLRDALSSVQN